MDTPTGQHIGSIPLHTIMVLDMAHTALKIVSSLYLLSLHVLQLFQFPFIFQLFEEPHLQALQWSQLLQRLSTTKRLPHQ